MGHGPCSSFEARKSAHLRMTEESVDARHHAPRQGRDLAFDSGMMAMQTIPTLVARRESMLIRE